MCEEITNKITLCGSENQGQSSSAQGEPDPAYPETSCVFFILYLFSATHTLPHFSTKVWT